MKKIIFLILFVILGVNFVAAQSKSIETIQSQIKSLNAAKSISIEYDKSSNYAKLMLLSDGFGSEQNKKNGLSSFTFGVMHGFSGNALSNLPDVYILTFWVKGKNTRFAESHAWKAKIDGETVDVGEGRYAKKNGDDREFLNFVVSRENFEKIAQGKQITFQIGNAEFTVSNELLKTFRNFLKISNPAF